MSMAQNMNLILQSCRYPSLLANDAVEPAIKNFNVLIGRLINESRVESQSKSPSEETVSMSIMSNVLELCIFLWKN